MWWLWCGLVMDRSWHGCGTVSLWSAWLWCSACAVRLWSRHGCSLVIAVFKVDLWFWSGESGPEARWFGCMVVRTWCWCGKAVVWTAFSFPKLLSLYTVRAVRMQSLRTTPPTVWLLHMPGHSLSYCVLGGTQLVPRC